MIDVNSILIWQKFNCYDFDGKSHSYYYKGKRVRFSVTQFLHRFYEEFDSDTISKRYAEKHGLSQEDVLAEWEKAGKVSSLAGTIIHSYLENAKRGKTFDIDYSEAEKEGLLPEVAERVERLLPKAKVFHQETINRLFPVHLEYTVGIEDIIAGNIDMLCWNEKAQEFQLWDYKNLKEMTTRNNFNKMCKGAFSCFQDCHLIKYSMQQNFYKVILQRVLGVKIGKCYLVHFNYSTDDDNFEVYECVDLQRQCEIELDNLIRECS